MWAPSWKTIALHAASAIGGGVAVLGFAASHSVDLYALVDQVNVVIREVGKLAAIAAPIISGAIAVWRSTPKAKLQDLAADPDFKGAIVAPALASAVPSNKVVDKVQELPAAAKV